MALWNQRAPKLLRAEGLSCLFQALSPLSAIWFSARLMDELGGSRDPGHLAFWAALALGCAALLSPAQPLGSNGRHYELLAERADFCR